MLDENISNHPLHLDLENYGFLLTVEFIERKRGFVKLIVSPRVDAERQFAGVFDMFQFYSRFSFGAGMPIPQDLIESFAEYKIKCDPFFSALDDSWKVMILRSTQFNGDLSVSLIERIERIGIPEFISFRNRHRFY